ncbi:hypothetical protein SLEP1_g38489 [Rubroshorea leprosula]|nr:hypothetical protein SLEP1_g38489 [Rubroshorea leprosula]
MNYPRPFHRHILAGISHDQFQLLSSHQTGHKEMNAFFPVAATNDSFFLPEARLLPGNSPPNPQFHIPTSPVESSPNCVF